MIIQESLKTWDEHPITTIIETKPITEILLPKVVVCPPKNTFTDLNYDLKMLQNMTLDDQTRDGLLDFAMEILYQDIYEEVLKNLSKLQDHDRYYNWYYGYSNIVLPRWEDDGDGLFYYSMSVGATSTGTISTLHFDEKFDADKEERHLRYDITIHTPPNVKRNPNVTLHLEIEKVSMMDLSNGEDTVRISDGWNGYALDQFQMNTMKNYTPPFGEQGKKSVALDRSVLLTDVKNQKLQKMPGFRFSWYYSGMEVKSIDLSSNSVPTKYFIRIFSNK